VVFEVGETEILFPVPMAVPPQLPVNHSATAPVPAEPPETVKVVDEPIQIVVVPDMPVGAEEKLWLFMVTSS